MEKKTQFNFWYLLIALSLVWLFHNWWSTGREVKVIPYSQFEELLKEGQIEEVHVGQRYLEGRLKEPIDERERFATTRVEPGLAEQLNQYGVKFSGVVEDTFISDILSWVIPILFFFALWMFFFRRLAERQGVGGLMSVGKSKTKVYVEKDTKVTFDDVAGVDEAKEELQEVVSFLQQPEDYGRLGAQIPKGVLLVGPLEPVRPY